jgi:hypothetical protein
MCKVFGVRSVSPIEWAATTYGARSKRKRCGDWLSIATRERRQNHLVPPLLPSYVVIERYAPTEVHASVWGDLALVAPVSLMALDQNANGAEMCKVFVAVDRNCHKSPCESSSVIEKLLR